MCNSHHHEFLQGGNNIHVAQIREEFHQKESDQLQKDQYPEHGGRQKIAPVAWERSCIKDHHENTDGKNERMLQTILYGVYITLTMA